MAAVVWLGLGREVKCVRCWVRLGRKPEESGERPGSQTDGENHADLGRGVSGQPGKLWLGWRGMPRRATISGAPGELSGLGRVVDSRGCAPGDTMGSSTRN